MADFYRSIYGPEAHPRWGGEWEGIASRDGSRTFMIWRNPNPDAQRISPYALPKGYMRNEMILLCKQERVAKENETA